MPVPDSHICLLFNHVFTYMHYYYCFSYYSEMQTPTDADCDAHIFSAKQNVCKTIQQSHFVPANCTFLNRTHSSVPFQHKN